jgi:hypothetical protein
VVDDRNDSVGRCVGELFMPTRAPGRSEAIARNALTLADVKNINPTTRALLGEPDLTVAVPKTAVAFAHTKRTNSFFSHLMVIGPRV